MVKVTTRWFQLAYSRPAILKQADKFVGVLLCIAEMAPSSCGFRSWFACHVLDYCWSELTMVVRWLATSLVT